MKVEFEGGSLRRFFGVFHEFSEQFSSDILKIFLSQLAV
jgi:hypothetical protein